MASIANFLDLPQEIIVMILTEHFADLEVTVKTAGALAERARRRVRRKTKRIRTCYQRWLGIALTAQNLHVTAMDLFFEHATFHCVEAELADLSTNYGPTHQLRRIRNVVGDIEFVYEIGACSNPQAIFVNAKRVLLDVRIYVNVHGNGNLCTIFEFQALKHAISALRQLGITVSGFIELGFVGHVAFVDTKLSLAFGESMALTVCKMSRIEEALFDRFRSRLEGLGGAVEKPGKEYFGRDKMYP